MHETDRNAAESGERIHPQSGRVGAYAPTAAVPDGRSPRYLRHGRACAPGGLGGIPFWLLRTVAVAESLKLIQKVVQAVEIHDCHSHRALVANR